MLVIDTQAPDSDPDARVSDSVTDALLSLGISSERVSGADRYATGAAVARKLGRFLRSRSSDPGDVGVMSGLGRTAVVASGEVFADALVAGPFSARGSHPVLLTPRDRLHPEVVSYLSSASVDHVVLMGGTAALSAGVEDSLTGLGVTVTRLAGATRYDTAIKAAELVQGRYGDASAGDCFGRKHIGLARARVPFYSFSAGPLLARLCAPLVLVDPQSIPVETAGFMDSARTAVGSDGIELTVFGGNAAVSDAALSEYLGRPITTVDTGDGDSSGNTDDGTAPAALPAGSCGGAATDPPTQLLPDQSAFYLAWSPDGNKIAYAFEQHGDGDWRASIWVINIDGSGKKQLTDGTFHDRGVSWSPDGSTIAFRRFFDDSGPGDHDDHGTYLMTMDASGKSLTQITATNSWGYSPVWSPSAVGTVRLAVLFVDFPNTQARHSTHAEVAESVPYMEEYLEDASAGKLDFSDIDAVMTIFSGDQFSIATATGNIDVGGRTVPTMRMNVTHHTETRQITANGWAAALELLHIFGLADLDGDGHSERPERKDGTVLVASDFGIMGLSIYSCIEEPDALVHIDPVALQGNGTLMAAVSVDNRRVIVVEARRNVERDQWVPFASSCTPSIQACTRYRSRLQATRTARLRGTRCFRRGIRSACWVTGWPCSPSKTAATPCAYTKSPDPSPDRGV